jgi:hypothetical protein
MGMSIEGVPIQGVIAQLVQTNREVAEQAVTARIKEPIYDPTKNVRELQQTSPFSQFLDVRV